MDTTYWQKLAAWRDDNHLTNATAAKRLGISRRTFESWVCGQREPRGLAKLALEAAISKPVRATKQTSRKAQG